MKQVVSAIIVALLILSQSYNFALAQLDTSTATSSADDVTLPAELPKTGMVEDTYLVIGGGLFLMLVGVLFYWKIVPKLLFDENSEVVAQPDHKRHL